MAEKEYIARSKIFEFPIRANHCDKENANKHFISGVESVMEYVENLPSADVQPVVHGRWMYMGVEALRGKPMKAMYCCSECLREEQTEEMLHPMETMKREFPYCHCGAKMDKEVEDV